EVLAACDELALAGYRLALDHYAVGDAREPLLRLARYVKINVLQYTEEELVMVADQLRAHDVRLIAEKVESRTVHQRCIAAGFELFQGYLFSRPEDRKSVV